MWIKKWRYDDLVSRIEKLEKAARSYGELCDEDSHYFVSGTKLHAKLSNLEDHFKFRAGPDFNEKDLTAAQIIKRFSELYNFLGIDRVDEPCPALRKR